MLKSHRIRVVAFLMIPFLASQAPALAVDCFTPPSGLVSHWRAQSTAEDLAGINPGTLVNGATFAPGIVGSAFSFDGVDDYVDVADHPTLDLASGEFTIAVWVNPDVCPNVGLDNASLVIKESGTVFAAYSLSLFQGQFSFASSGNAAAWGTLMQGGVCAAGAWHHVSVTQSAGVANLYVNGLVVSTDNTAVTPLNTILPMRFGLREDGSSSPGLQPVFLDGRLDEVMLFDRALGSGEIQTMFDAGMAGACLVPAVSEWGLVALTLLGLTAGTVVFGRHRRPTRIAG